jgi:hypothetical protein
MCSGINRVLSMQRVMHCISNAKYEYRVFPKGLYFHVIGLDGDRVRDYP